MRGKGKWYDNAAIETFFTPPSRDIAAQYPAEQRSRLNCSGDSHGKLGGKLRWRSLNTSMASTIRAEDTRP